MAETPSDQSPAPAPAPAQHESGSGMEYWCYQCDKRVAVETLAAELVCYECKAGFVESIPAPPTPDEETGNPIDDHSLGNQFIQLLRLISQVARDDDAPPPPPPSDPSDGDYLRIELDGWDNDNVDDDEDEEDEDDDERSVEVLHDEEVDNSRRYAGSDRSEGEDEDEIEVIEPRDDEEEMRRQRRDVLRLRLRDFASRAATRRNRILDWAEILMGLEDHSIELRLHSPDSDTYIGNPGDYVDAAGYETLLQNLAESDSGARRGAPPAAKSAVEGLESLVIGEEEKAILCAICKDLVNVSQVGKSLPCGHGYHGGCIVPWLETRNSCPVCRFELPTDDPEYEEERKKRAVASSSGGSGESGVE